MYVQRKFYIGFLQGFRKTKNSEVLGLSIIPSVKEQ